MRLECAVIAGHVQLVEWLLSQGANARNQRRKPLLITVVESEITSRDDRLRLAEMILEQDSANIIDATDGNGVSPLFTVVRRGENVFIELFLDYGAFVSVNQLAEAFEEIHMVDPNSAAMARQMVSATEGLARAATESPATVRRLIQDGLVEQWLDAGGSFLAMVYRDEEISNALTWALRRDNVELLRLALARGKLLPFDRRGVRFCSGVIIDMVTQVLRHVENMYSIGLVEYFAFLDEVWDNFERFANRRIEVRCGLGMLSRCCKGFYLNLGECSWNEEPSGSSFSIQHFQLLRYHSGAGMLDFFYLDRIMKAFIEILDKGKDRYRAYDAKALLLDGAVNARVRLWFDFISRMHGLIRKVELFRSKQLNFLCGMIT